MLDSSTLQLIATGGAGLIALVIVALFVSVLRGQNKTNQDIVRLQSSGAETTLKLANVIGDMQTGAKARDQQIDLTLKQMDLVLKAMDRNALAAESQNALLLGIRNETTASGDRTQALHDALVSSVNDTSSAIGTMTSHIVGQVDKSEAALVGKIDLIPQKVLEIFEPTRSEIVVKLDTLGPDVAKALVPDIEHMFKDCLELAKENDALVKEVQEANRRANIAEQRLAVLIPPMAAAVETVIADAKTESTGEVK